MTVLHIHIPSNAPNLDAIVDVLVEEGSVEGYFDRGDSYREWGEPQRDDDPQPNHIVLFVEAEFAEGVYNDLASQGVHADVTLEDDWSSIVTWGQCKHPGWFDYYRK